MASSGGGFVVRTGAVKRVRGKATAHATSPCTARGYVAPPSPSLQGKLRNICKKRFYYIAMFYVSI